MLLLLVACHCHEAASACERHSIAANAKRHERERLRGLMGLRDGVLLSDVLLDFWTAVWCLDFRGH
jgi:hypothetical protein